MERETVMHRATILDPPTEPVPKPELICEPYVHATEKRVFLINLNSFELWHGHGDTHHRHTYIHDSLRLMSTVITLHSISAGSPINARGLCPCLTRGPVRLSGGRARSASTPSLSQRTHSHFLGVGCPSGGLPAALAALWRRMARPERGSPRRRPRGPRDGLREFV